MVNPPPPTHTHTQAHTHTPFPREAVEVEHINQTLHSHLHPSSFLAVSYFNYYLCLHKNSVSVQAIRPSSSITCNCLQSLDGERESINHSNSWPATMSGWRPTAACSSRYPPPPPPLHPLASVSRLLIHQLSIIAGLAVAGVRSIYCYKLYNII